MPQLTAVPLQMHWSRPIAALIGLTLAVGGCASSDPATGPPAPGTPAAASAATPAPDTEAGPAAAVPASLMFSADLVAGGRFDGATLVGRPTVVWFWAAWCPRCRAKATEVRMVQGEFGTKVAFVGVAGLSSGLDPMQSFVSQYGLGGFPQLADDAGAVWRHFGVVEQEYFVIIDAGGTIVHKGPLGADELRDRVATLAG
jgi:peroxiredoxin